MPQDRFGDQDVKVDQDRLDHLKAVVGAGPVLVLTHDNPDPDALASGKALAALLQGEWNISSRLNYSGLVERSENQTMLERLTPEWQYDESLAALDTYPVVAMVDTQPGAGNNRLPLSRVPDIVFDHHQPIRETAVAVPHADIRPETGATVTILYEYLERAEVSLDPRLATAMFYGLRTDTRGLSRGVSSADEMAYLRLHALVDHKELIRVEQAGLTREHFGALDRGLQAAQIHGNVVVVRLGLMSRPDLPAEIADLLIRLESARAVLCQGWHGDILQVSLRTKPLTDDAGELIQRVVVAPGKAGGHGSMAGGQVPLENASGREAAEEVEARFLRLMGETGEGVSLLDG